MKGHEGPVLSIAVSSDGNKLVSGGSDNVLALWDCEIKRKANGLDGHSKPIWGVDITPDSRYIASASSDHTVRIWNIATGLVQRVFTGHTEPVWAAKFSHSSRYVATASSDGTAAIYRLATGGIKLVLAHSDAVWDVAWSKDDRSLFTSCRGLVIRRWNAKHGSVVAEYRGHTKAVKALSISTDGMRMASASLDASIRIWDLSTDRCERVLQRKDGGAVSVEWLNDECLAAGYTSGCVRLWNAHTGQREIGFLPGHSRRTNAVSGSPDGSRIVSASTDKEIRIWNIATEECERRIPGGSGLGICCVKWAQDGHYIVSGGSDRAICVWQPETGRCVHVMGGVGGIGIYEVNWSPSGKLVASGSCDRKVEIWNPETGECLHSLKGHTNWVHTVDWEEGEKRILSRSDDGTARVWNVETGACENVFDDAVVPEGFLISSSGVSKTVDLSGKADVGNPIGIDIHKARVYEDMCCGWIGKTVYFFKLKKSTDLQKTPQNGVNPPDGYVSSVVELKD
jgi:WD40 repeat protein